MPCPDCNVLLISLDTLRADHLSLYGYERPTSPYLETLAEDAVVFEQVFNHGGHTLPEHVSIFTSLPPRVHRIRNIDTVHQPARVTLTEQLKAADFQTAAFTDGAWMSARYGLTQGFDSYDDEGGGLAATLPKVLSWIESHRDAPWFVFLHTYDIHTRPDGDPAYLCPGDWDERFYPDRDEESQSVCVGKHCGAEALGKLSRKRLGDPSFPIEDHVTPDQLRVLVSHYDGCIRWVDDRMRELVDQLEEWGEYERTLIVITSDHGEKFLEHDQILHNGEPFEELVHVPLIFKLPGQRHGGRRVDALASSVDLMPTLLGVVGVTPNSDAQGHNLMLTLEDGRPQREFVTFSRGIRTADWKLISVKNEQSRLFDLNADPGERRDLARSHRKRRLTLEGQLRTLQDRQLRQREAFQQRIEGAESAPTPRATESELEQLRALGYID
jgi:arylsulfatase